MIGALYQNYEMEPLSLCVFLITSFRLSVITAADCSVTIETIDMHFTIALYNLLQTKKIL